MPIQAINTEFINCQKTIHAYMKSLTVEPVTQSLKLRSDPAYGRVKSLSGEYQATYKKFYQKMDDGDKDEKKYNVRIIFRCRVSGGINNHPG